MEQNWPAFLEAFLQGNSTIEGVPSRVVNALIDGLTLTGSVDEMDSVIERLKAFEAAGMTEIALRLHQAPHDAIEMIGKYIVPAMSE